MLSSGLRFPLVEISPLVCRTTFTVRGKAGRLSAGTTLTVISNTAATPIVGTFANLPDHSIVTIGGNHFQVNYEGGDGNDLTLTVVP